MLKILQPIKIPYPGFSSPSTVGLLGPSTQMIDRQPQSLLYLPTSGTLVFLAPNVKGKLPLHSSFAFYLTTTLSQPSFLPNPAEHSRQSLYLNRQFCFQLSGQIKDLIFLICKMGVGNRPT